MAIKKQVSTNDPFEALYLRQADPSAGVTVDTSGAEVEWIFDESDRITQGIKTIHEGKASFTVRNAEELLQRDLGVVLSYHGHPGPQKARGGPRGPRKPFSDDLKRQGLAMKEKGTSTADIQRALEAEGGPSYQTWVKFFKDIENGRGRRK